MDSRQSYEDLIYLAACAVKDAVPEEARVAEMDLEEVYALASRHMVKAAAAFALESAGKKDKRSAGAIAAAMRKNVLFDREWGLLRARLEEEGIWYMPLKGAVLKNLYPKYAMREYADHDILFDSSRAEDVKAIMEELGFTAEHFGSGNHDVYFKAPCLNFEMHRALFGPSHEEKIYEYYKNTQERLQKGKGCERFFTPEDFYLYFLAHEYKHYEGGGTGLRSLLDTWVYLHSVTLDMSYVGEEAGKLGIRDFEERNRSLALRLFSGEERSEAEEVMLSYFLSSGTYGTVDHRVENTMRKNGWGKLRYMLDRFLVPVSGKNKSYAMYAGAYPLFYQHRMLLPLLPLYRTFRAMKAGRFWAEAKAVRRAKPGQEGEERSSRSSV